MKRGTILILVVLVACNLIGPPCATADDAWCDAIIAPEHPTSNDDIAIGLSGLWPDSCVPSYFAQISVADANVFIDVIWPYPSGTSCLTVMTEWFSEAYIGRLPEGHYTIYSRVVGGGYEPSTYTETGHFDVVDNQFVLSDDSVAIAEGGSNTFTVSLARCDGPVQVNISRESGDVDINIEPPQTLFFDPLNYGIGQTVTLTAAEDLDYYDSQAVLSISATGYLTTTITAVEIDNDIPEILYVDAHATGAETGVTWADAFTNLHNALTDATIRTEIREIRVAGGVYVPTNAGDKNSTFKLVYKVEVKGSYAGTRYNHPNFRSLDRYPSVLSGDTNGDDAPGFVNRGDNVWTVVTTARDATLDGFIVAGGRASLQGGGIRCLSPGMRLTNCIITDNSGRYGGGLCVYESNILVSNCLFIANQTSESGDGGAVYLYDMGDCSPTFLNSTFVRNSADRNGGAICCYAPNTKIMNCIFWDNSDRGGTDESAQIHSNTVTVDFSCVQGWSGLVPGTGSMGANPLFVDPENGDCHLKSQAGHWNPDSSSWIVDDVTSPCVDTGHPLESIGLEPFPNGGRINMGAYGGIALASKSYFGTAICETIIAGDINGDCKVDFTDFALLSVHWFAD